MPTSIFFETEAAGFGKMQTRVQEKGWLLSYAIARRFLMYGMKNYADAISRFECFMDSGCFDYTAETVGELVSEGEYDAFERFSWWFANPGMHRSNSVPVNEELFANMLNGEYEEINRVANKLSCEPPMTPVYNTRLWVEQWIELLAVAARGASNDGGVDETGYNVNEADSPGYHMFDATTVTFIDMQRSDSIVQRTIVTDMANFKPAVEEAKSFGWYCIKRVWFPAWRVQRHLKGLVAPKRFAPTGFLQIAKNASIAGDEPLRMAAKRALECEMLERAIRRRLGVAAFAEISAAAKERVEEQLEA